ncbi:trypsin-like serine protease [bacterium]|nr:trypsin-like serine protease [bacterium]
MKRNVYAKPWRDLMSKNLCILSLFISGCATYLPLEPVTALLQCTQAVRPRDSIVDGQEVGLWDPDQKLVLMLYVKRNHQESICTGTLISNRVILTAAHCVSDVNPQDITPYFVMTSGCPINQVRRKPAVVQMMVVHRDFDGSPKSLADMALLYLDEDAPTEQVRLPVIKSHQKITNDQILLVGFGVTDEQKKDSQVLRRVYKSLNRDVTPKNKVLILDQSKKNGGFVGVTPERL